MGSDESRPLYKLIAATLGEELQHHMNTISQEMCTTSWDNFSSRKMVSHRDGSDFSWIILDCRVSISYRQALH